MTATLGRVMPILRMFDVAKARSAVDLSGLF